MAVIKFGPWLPDLPAYENDGLIDAVNAIPGSGGYRPFQGPTVIGSTNISATAIGAYSFIDDQNTSRIYVGTSSKIWGLEGSGHIDYSRTGDYSVPIEGFWEFNKFNQGQKQYVLAVNGNDYMQRLQVGGNEFEDVSAAPLARHIGIVKQFVVLGSIGVNRNAVHWSAVGDAVTWPELGTELADAVLSGRQDLANDGGPIHGVVGGDIGYIFQENTITRMSFVGGSVVFQFDQIANLKGVVGPNAWVRVGAIVYYLANDGFHAFDGSSSQPIGEGRVDHTFFNTITLTDLRLVQATSDITKNLIIWRFPVTGATDQLYVYNYVADAWTRVEHDVQWLFPSYGSGTTLEELDSYSAGGSTIDSIPISLDTALLNRGRAILSGYNDSFQLVDYSGTALTATFETAEVADPQGRRTYINEVRPMIEASATTVQVGSRNVQTGTETFSASSDVQTTGIANFRVEGRYHRMKFHVKDLTQAVGYEVFLIRGGKF